jgi:hypothetical protein
VCECELRSKKQQAAARNRMGGSGGSGSTVTTDPAQPLPMAGAVPKYRKITF